MTSIWKDIPGYEGYYQASHDGFIRSVTKSVRQWSGGTQLKKGKVLKSCTDRLKLEMIISVQCSKKMSTPKYLLCTHQGLSAPQIGKLLGCSHDTIYRILKPETYAKRYKRKK